MGHRTLSGRCTPSAKLSAFETVVAAQFVAGWSSEARRKYGLGRRHRRILAVTMRARCHFRSRKAASRCSRSNRIKGEVRGRQTTQSQRCDALARVRNCSDLSVRYPQPVRGAHKKAPGGLPRRGSSSSTRHASIKERCRGGRGREGRSCPDSGFGKTPSAWLRRSSS